MEKEYYLGLDMGTSSLGWAVTDKNYRLLRAKGKDLWGVRLFKEAETSADRRSHRTNRRRHQREKVRIGYLKEIFAEEINKIDPGFYQRLNDSKYFLDDKSVQQPFALFADCGYTDKEYYEQYPTIFHLRKELIESKEAHDVRLVFLAILNMYKHRGHFLNANLSEGGIGNLQSLYRELGDMTAFEKDIDITAIETILSSKKISNSMRLEKLLETLQIAKKSPEAEMLKLICGLTGTLSKAFPQDEYDEETAKMKLSFQDGNFEEKLADVESVLSEESYEILMVLKQIHDWGLLANIMKSDKETYQYLSFARVDAYEKHHYDLGILKKLYKTYASKQYDSMFRVLNDNNYSAYVGTVNSKMQKKLAAKEKERRGVKCNTDDFFKNIRNIVSKMPKNKDTQYVLEEIEKGTFLPKQLVSSNGVIPNQVHKTELKKILENAESYLPFLKEKDETSLTNSEKILQLFSFQIPYYVGPLYNDKEHTAWSVRKETGKVLPWNFEQKVDVKASAEAFIGRMVKHCTYLNDENVLPKNSLLYEKFMVLNELNNLKINSEPVSVELKQKIYEELFKKEKKVTGKRLETYLKEQGFIEKKDAVEITGIDGDFTSTLSNYRKFKEILQVDTLSYEQEKMAENIIFWSTVYGDSKGFLKDKIKEEYGTILSKEQLKRISGIKFKDWGRLSKQLLMLEGADKETGEIKSIIARMWDENYNLMELLGSNFTYKEEIEKKSLKLEKTLREIEYEDLEGLYLSAPVKRMTWQTIQVIKELYQVLGNEPTRIFIEMARDTDTEKERTQSRKKKFAELYKSCKEDGRDWIKEISDTEETKFRSKKLYLYYTQKGRCMYTGETIELTDLFNDNLYDIDHIYPRHFVKDDSIENNLVLVKKETNAHKKDIYPLETSIRTRQHDMWKVLVNTGFITKEKYNRLTRTIGFTEEEQAAFVSRQIVETRQGTKVIAKLFEQTFANSDVIYVKAGNVSAFRQQFDLLKCREVNDLHHAKDAYLNIVVGNTYFVKFTKNPINFVKEYRKNPEKNKYHMYKLFEYPVARGNDVAWKTEHDESIGIVKKMINKGTPLVTMMNFEAHGGLADQTIYSAKEAEKVDGEGYISIKGSDKKISDVCRYGGLKKYTGAYFFLVEHVVKGKKIRTLEPMPLYLKEQLGSREKIEKYCSEKLGYKGPSVRIEKIKMYSLIKVDGYYLYLTGRKGNQLSVSNAVQLNLDYESEKYIKRIASVKNMGLSQQQLDNAPDITKERNCELYDVLMRKHRDTIFSHRPNSVGEKLLEWKENFEDLKLTEQIYVLLQIIRLTGTTNAGADLVLLGGKKTTGVASLNKKISDKKEFTLINQSLTGLYENEIDLLNV